MITVYDLLPEFNSYVADMEANLILDPETFADYQDDPRPFLGDLLYDFATYIPENFDAAVNEALESYCSHC